jgi:hypothetical protein
MEDLLGDCHCLLKGCQCPDIALWWLSSGVIMGYVNDGMNPKSFLLPVGEFQMQQ